VNAPSGAEGTAEDAPSAAASPRPLPEPASSFACTQCATDGNPFACETAGSTHARRCGMCRRAHGRTPHEYQLHSRARIVRMPSSAGGMTQDCASSSQPASRFVRVPVFVTTCADLRLEDGDARRHQSAPRHADARVADPPLRRTVVDVMFGYRSGCCQNAPQADSGMLVLVAKRLAEHSTQPYRPWRSPQ